MSFFKQIPEPAVSRRGLVIGAGLFWILGGSMLIWRAVSLPEFVIEKDWWIFLPAIAVGLAKTRFIFRRIVRRNVLRIEALAPEKARICLFAFQSLESYLLVLAMILLGLLLRATPLSDSWLAAIYVAIGSALILSSALFFRARLAR